MIGPSFARFGSQVRKARPFLGAILMQAKVQERLKQNLRDTRSRIVAQARHLSDSLNESAAVAGEGSAAPVHLSRH